MTSYGGTPSSSHTPSASTSQAIVPLSERPRSLNRQVVLEEDEYTAALSHIIARDFFPSLQGLDATNAYLEAVSSGDSERVAASVRQLAAIETPTADAAGLSRRGKKRALEEVYRSVSLDDFQAKFTSEDNASFTEILEEENRKRKERWGWAYEAEKRAKTKALEWKEKRARMISMESSQHKLLTQAGERPAKGTELASAGEEDDADEASVVALVCETVNRDQSMDPMVTQLPDEPETAPWDPNNILSRPVDKREASVPTWSFTARNALMFPPDVDTTPYGHTPAESGGPPEVAEKAINHANTRLPEFEAPSTRGEPPSPSRSRISRAIRGSISAMSIDSLSDTEGPRGAYPLVDAIPTPSPDMLGPERLKQLMTWGTLSATPRPLSSDAGDAGTERSPFTIAPPTPRDSLAHRLGTSASRSLREKAAMYTPVPGSTRSARAATPAGRGSMPPPSFIPNKREDTLSPAARNLLNKTGVLKSSSLGNSLNRTAAKRRAEAMDRAGGWESGGPSSRLNGARWTPSPSARRIAD